MKPAFDLNRTLAWLGAGAVVLAFIHQPRLPLAEAAVGALFVCACAATRRPAAPLAALLAAGWLIFSTALQTPAGSAWSKLAEYVGIFFLAPAGFAAAANCRPRLLPAGLAVAWGISLGVALAQSWSPAPGALGQGAGFGSAALFGIIAAAFSPLVFSFILSPAQTEKPGPARIGLALGLAALLAFSQLYLPALMLGLVALLAWGGFCAPRGVRLPAILTALALAGLFILPTPLLQGRHETLRRSVATTDAHGIARRWTLEARAALAAIRDQPLFGHGADRYQPVVSSGRYRAGLPPTAENKVDPGTQCGYLVLAVQHGLPAALLVAAALLAAAFGLRRHWTALSQSAAPAEQSYVRPAILSLLLLTVGLTFTPLLVQGAGLLVGWAMGFAAALNRLLIGDKPSAQSPSGSRPRLAGRGPWLQGAFMAALLAVGRLVGPGQPALSPHTPASGDLPRPESTFFLFEAAQAAKLPAAWEIVEEPEAAGGRALHAPDRGHNPLVASDAADYAFKLARPGEFRLWLRAWWRDGCGNSAAAAPDAQTFALIGNDGTYGAWHWVPGPTYQLAAGEHVLRVAPRENGASLDQILLVDDLDFYPSGLLGRKTVSAKAANAAPPPLKLAAIPAGPRFLAAIGGMYQNGPEAILTGLGIPYERLRNDELADPAALARYNLIWLSGVTQYHEQVWKVVNAFVKKGGTAILERLRETADRRSYNPSPEENELVPGGELGGVASRGLRVRAGNSPFFAGQPEEQDLYPDIVCSRLSPPPAGTGEAHGQLLFRKKPFGPAFTKYKFGQGTVYALALPLGNISMWRGQKFDPIAKRVVRDALGDRYEPLYADLDWKATPAGEVNFADDFMRNPGEGAAWKVESGWFRLTGAPAPVPPRFSKEPRAEGPPHPFALEARQPGWAAAGNPHWRDYRVSLTVLTDQGAGGPWLTTTQNRRLQLIYAGATGRLALEVVVGDKVETLAESVAAAPYAGWRRLSLFARDGLWQGWLDGRPALTIPAGDENPEGRFGVAHRQGTAFYDDIRVRDTAVLLAGGDTCLGEEGSPRSDPPLRVGLEPRTIYSPQWYLRPLPFPKCSAVSIPLPLYQPAIFWLDGQACGQVMPGQTTVPLPAPVHRDLALACPGWRDYNFCAEPAEWYSTGQEWKRVSRWSCDQQWEWLGVNEAGDPAALWYRHPVTPPYSVIFFAGPSMGHEEGFHEKDRDLNLVFGGDGQKVDSGYLLRTGPAGGPGCELWKDGKKLAAAPAVGLPRGGGLTLHHRWLWLQLTVEAGRVRFAYEGRPALEAKLPTPPKGHLGFWTEHGSAQVARATLSLSDFPPPSR